MIAVSVSDPRWLAKRSRFFFSHKGERGEDERRRDGGILSDLEIPPSSSKSMS